MVLSWLMFVVVAWFVWLCYGVCGAPLMSNPTFWASLRCQVVSWITRISPGFGRFDTFMWQDIYLHNRNKSPFVIWIQDPSVEYPLSSRILEADILNPMFVSGWIFQVRLIPVVWADGQWYKSWLLVGSKLSIYLMSRSPSVRPCLMYHNIARHAMIY